MVYFQESASILIFAVLVQLTQFGSSQFIKVGLELSATTTASTPIRIVAPFRTRTTAAPQSRRHLITDSPESKTFNGETLFQARQKRNIFKQWLTFMNESSYDKYLIPKVKEDAPLEVTVSIMIIRVHSVSDSSMDFGIEMYYRERWVDYRLAYDASEYDDVKELNLPMAALNYVWKPDTYFLNAISAVTDDEKSVTHRAFFRLNTTGHVHYSRKISLTADCPMDLSMYPFDKQYCKLKLGTYSHSKKDLVYNWAKPRGHDVELKDSIVLPEFYGEAPKTRRRELNYTTGSFDSLELCIKFKRSAGFCVLQVFIPATAVVMSSWVALWMAEDTTFSDVLAVILAVIFLAYAYNSVMPRVSYVKLLDLYMCSCFLFVFLSLAKLVIIKYFCKKWAKENNQSSDWFLAQLAGISMAQQQQHNSDDVEKGVADKGPRRVSGLSSDSSSLSNGIGKKASNQKECNGPTTLIVPPLAIQRNRRPMKKRKSNVLFPAADSDSEEDFKSAIDQSGTKKGSDDDETETDQFIVTNSNLPEKSDSSDHEDNGDRQRKMTFLGIEAFSEWFNEKNKKKESELERKMKFLRWFHVVTQLALPIAFGGFFIFLLLVYPNVPDTRGC